MIKNVLHIPAPLTPYLYRLSLIFLFSIFNLKLKISNGYFYLKNFKFYRRLWTFTLNTIIHWFVLLIVKTKNEYWFIELLSSYQICGFKTLISKRLTSFSFSSCIIKWGNQLLKTIKNALHIPTPFIFKDYLSSPHSQYWNYSRKDFKGVSVGVRNSVYKRTNPDVFVEATNRLFLFLVLLFSFLCCEIHDDVTCIILPHLRMDCL